MNKRNAILGIVTAIVVGAILGYAGGSHQYAAQLDTARKALPVQATMSSVLGKITGISGNIITITQPILNPPVDPFEDLPAVRHVTVTSATNIVKDVVVDPSVFQQEMTAYQAAIQKIREKGPTAGVDVPAQPIPVIQTTLTLSDLKVGDMITVDAGTDVKTITSFDAVTITVNEITPIAASTAFNITPAPTSTSATGR